MDKSGLTVFLLPLAVCLPCLLVLLAAAGGAALVTGAVAWIAGNTIIAVAALGVAIALGGAAVLNRSRYEAACDAGARTRESREH